MTNKQLIERLQNLPLDYEIYIDNRKSDDAKLAGFIIDGELNRISLKSE